MILSKLYALGAVSVAYAVQVLSTPNAVNDTNHVQLASYNYTAGTFSADFFIHNDNYDKTVFLYYTNNDGQSSPLTALAADYSASLADNWELWSLSSAIYQEEGLQELLNVTFNALNIGKTYSQVLNIKVTQENPGEQTEEEPTPKISPSGLSKDITNWLNPQSVNSQSFISKQRVFDNINVEGSVKGLVIASPSKEEPDYYYHWIRDAGLTFDAIFKLYEALPNRRSQVAQTIESYFFDYITAAVQEQEDKTAIAGLGEPKFYLGNNSGYQLAWGRPQNDGPAIRAFAIIEFVKEYIKKGGNKDYILKKTWEKPIKVDLNFIASNWTYSNFDLWEEVDSDHFFTKMVQRRALVQGAQFASQYLRDVSTYKTLNQAANSLNATLSNFIYPIRNLILNTYGAAQRGKTSYKDLSTVLAINHANIGDGVFAPTNDWCVRSVYEIATSFIDVYSLSKTTKDKSGQPLAPPTGRYPEDVYNGTGTSLANPWFLSNAAFAEYFYTIAKNFQDSGSIPISNLTLPFWKYYAGVQKVGTISKNSRHKRHSNGSNNSNNSKQFQDVINSLLGWGDAYFRNVKAHAGTDGHLSEQFNKDTGAITGARDLTWSYASVITASIARANAQGDRDFTQQLSLLQDKSGHHW